ncbi:MAG: hypothetical protein M1819_006930 [Sarea resinae]|nr:MAG: hypothetical protein M1819_006930 [Sarea resinae]
MASSVKGKEAPTNPRGIPYAPFVDRVEDYVSSRVEVEGTLKSFQEMISIDSSLVERYRHRRYASCRKGGRGKGKAPLRRVVNAGKKPATDQILIRHRKYQFMEVNTQRRAVGLREKIPDIQKTLDTVQFMKTRKADSDPIDTTFELNDTLYAKAVVPATEDVYLWLGANVMLSYPIAEAETLLESKLAGAQQNLGNCEEDLDFLREQITGNNGSSPRPAALALRPKPILSLNPSFDRSGSEKERRYLDFFRNRTVPEFLQYYDSSFWNRVVLQASHSEPAVRHALVALGSLHWRLKAHKDLPFRYGHPDEELSYALQQYNKAIGYLSQQIARMGCHEADVALISCVLFICFESFLGNYDSVVLHLQNGLRILCQSPLDVAKCHQSTTSSHIFSPDRDYLIKLFGRLNLQITLFLDSQSQQLRIFPSPKKTLERVPDIFASLDEARDYLVYQSNAMIQLLQSADHHPEILDGEALHVALARQAEIEAHLQQWSAAFNRYLMRFDPGMDSRDLRGAALLKIHHITSAIMLTAGFSGAESAFDEFDCEFEKTISLSQSLIANTGPGSLAGPQPSFSSDLGIVAPLFFTAFKCRNPSIRRQAISLLSASPRREGVWDSTGTAKVADWVVMVEERGLGHVAHSKDVPESARVCRLDAKPFMAQRRVHIRYSTRSSDGNYNKLCDGEEWLSW